MDRSCQKMNHDDVQKGQGPARKKRKKIKAGRDITLNIGVRTRAIALHKQGTGKNRVSLFEKPQARYIQSQVVIPNF